MLNANLFGVDTDPAKHLVWLAINRSEWHHKCASGLSRGSVVKNPPANAGDVG